jgi:hypothetical protein
MITATRDQTSEKRQGGVWDYVSPSRLGLWAKCPLAWKFRYLDGMWVSRQNGRDGNAAYGGIHRGAAGTGRSVLIHLEFWLSGKKPRLDRACSRSCGSIEIAQLKEMELFPSTEYWATCRQVAPIRLEPESLGKSAAKHHPVRFGKTWVRGRRGASVNNAVP